MSILLIYDNKCFILEQIENSAVKINRYESVAQSDEALFCAIAKQPVAVALDATSFQHYVDVSSLPVSLYIYPLNLQCFPSIYNIAFQ